MSYNFLDKTGLTYFYDKIKTIFAKKEEIPTKTSQLTNDSYFNNSREVTGGSIDALATYTSDKQGMTGSISLAKKSSGIGSEIPAGWYNFYFSPHRTGVGGDNGRYGTIILTPMNFSGKSWMLQRSNSTNTITGVKEILTQVSGDTKNNYVLNNNFYVNTHPENNPVLIPFINNDIAFMLKRGGSVNIYYDGVEKSIDISNVFDGSPSYGLGINPTGTTEIVIVLNLHKTFTWNNTIYSDFGSAGWRAKDVKIEVINTNYAQDVWTEKYHNTNNGSGSVYVTTAHTPVGASNQGGGFNKVRFTFKTWATATIFRISQLGIYNYGSLGSRETSMSRGIDDYIFRNITPNSNNTYNLGSSSNKWANVYATTFNGNATSATTSTSASKLKNFYSTRPTDINTTPSGDGGLIKFVATSSTTTGKPPSGDANVVQMNWDSTAGWDSQFAICTGEVAEFEFRNQRNSVWSSWKRLLRKDDMASSTNDGVMSSTDKAKLDGIANGATANTGTVTSVAVKMNNTTKGTVTTSGTIDLGTVITSHQDISGKQDKLATQTAYTSKGSATKVPQITTNTLGQVTGITEVTITQPTVNNGTLTIQKNGTNVQTFSANQSGNATANITVPTKVSELTNDSGYTSNTGTITGVSVNSTSIATSGVANIVTNTAYNSSSNKIATMTDVYNNKGAETPVGTIFAYVAEEPPTGYLLCDGSAVSRTTYDELFDVIGTTYGSGDGSTTFNLPDLRRRHALMKGASDSLGNTGGSEEIFALANPTGGGMNYSNAGRAFNTDYWIDGSGGSKGGGGRANNNAGIRIRGAEDTSSSRESYLICNYIIKAYSGTDAPLPVDTSFVKNVSDDSTVNTYSTNYINTKVKGKKLWENPNPTSNFAAQTITFDGTNDYDFYKIKIGFATDSGTGTNWQDVEVGDTFSLLLMWSYTPGIADPNTKGYIATGFRPECSCNHSSITFTNAVYYTSADSTKLVNNTSHCIPLEIYGYYI